MNWEKYAGYESCWVGKIHGILIFHFAVISFFSEQFIRHHSQCFHSLTLIFVTPRLLNCKFCKFQTHYSLIFFNIVMMLGGNKRRS